MCDAKDNFYLIKIKELLALELLITAIDFLCKYYLKLKNKALSTLGSLDEIQD